jgi:carbamate kinase
MRVVVALGGNALLRRGEPAEAELQRGHVREAAAALAGVARQHELVLTHGNGPQVGLLALEDAAYGEISPYPLDVLVAETQGMVGYLLAEALASELPEREVACLLTRVLVDAGDPAFETPTKPIGPVYDEAEARRVAAERGWVVARDTGGFRRVVASPEPRELLELAGIRTLVDSGAVVVCAGGGGIPVTEDAGRLRGVEAVVDKDLTAALLAERVGADRLIMLTDVDAVERRFGTPQARPIRAATPRALRRLTFAPGSMAPKVEAACRFVERTGGEAAIGSLAELDAIVAGDAGTIVRTLRLRTFGQARSAA